MIIILLKTVIIESCHRYDCDLVISVEKRERRVAVRPYIYN